MDFSQQRSVTSSQTMADIAAALARQSRFGAGFAGAAGMGMFANMNMQGMGMVSSLKVRQLFIHKIPLKLIEINLCLWLSIADRRLRYVRNADAGNVWNAWQFATWRWSQFRRE